MEGLARVLIVDDEVNLLNGLKRRLRGDFELICASSGEEAIRMVEEKGPIAATLCDMRMPDMDGVQTLQEIERRSPETIRMMLTGNADQETASIAINSGHIFRFFSKPCSLDELRNGIEQALKQYRLVTGEKLLLEQTLAGSVKVLINVLGLINPSWVKDSNRVRQWLIPIAKELKIDDFWQLDLAAMLAPIGRIAIPPDIDKKLTLGEELTSVEAEIVVEAPKRSRDLIANIPRLTEVAEIVYLHQKNFDGTGYPLDALKQEDIPISARVLRILLALAETTDNEDPGSRHFEKLRENAGTWFDPQLLIKIQECFEANGKLKKAPSKTTESIMAVKAIQLLPNDVLQEDLYSSTDQFLLAAGTKITEVQVAQLHNIHRLTGLETKIKIHRSTKPRTGEHRSS